MKKILASGMALLAAGLLAASLVACANHSSSSNTGSSGGSGGGSSSGTSSSSEIGEKIMKTGSEVCDLLKELGADDDTVMKSFCSSATPPATGVTTKKLSRNSSPVDVLAWLDGTTIKYYAAGYTDSGRKIPLMVSGVAFVNTETAEMFRGCKALSSIDVSGFDTSEATCLASMFQNCTGLTSLDLSSWNVSKVDTLAMMFAGCTRLSSVNLNGWDTGMVHNTISMFHGCSSLTSLNLSGWNTSRFESMVYMFSRCTSLTTIYASAGFNTTNVDGAWGYDMFYGCTSLVGGAGTTYSGSHTDKEYARIDGGPSSTTPGYFTAM